MKCGVGRRCRCSLDPALLWLWCRLAATALIQPLAWEPPYAAGAALKMREKKKSQSHSDPLFLQSIPPAVLLMHLPQQQPLACEDYWKIKFEFSNKIL